MGKIRLMIGLPLMALLLAGSAFAAGPRHVTDTPPKVNMGLLEFLGSWQGSDGRWVDPMMFASINLVQLEAAPRHVRDKSLMSTTSTKSGPERGLSDDMSRHS